MARRNKSRHLAKATEDVRARYDTASTSRRMAGWSTPSSGPNAAVTGLQKIRDRTRDLQRNEWSGAASVRIWTTNVIGTGIIPRLRTKSADLKTKINDLWTKWVPEADADQVLDFYAMQALVARSWFTSGECFARLRPRRVSDGLTVPMQVQILESDMVPLLDADVYAGLPKGNKIRQGIELDSIGRKVAVWFWKQHPGEPRTEIDASLLSRVPAESVCHIYEVLRPGQLRGIPEMASVVAKLKNVGDFDDAVLTRQHLANLFTLFVTKPFPSGASDVMTGQAFVGDPNDPIAALEPGSSMELIPGEDVKFSTPPDAGANYDQYMRTQMLGVAAGTGTPYELLTGDLKDVSDRTLRIILNEFHRLCEVRQWHMLIPQFCTKVRNAWVDMAVLSGDIAMSEMADAKNVEWAPHAWPYIHPVQDVQGKKLEVEAGFKSRTGVISSRGDDPEAVDQERADDKKREDDLGLTPPPPPDPAASPEAKKAEAKALSHINVLLEKTESNERTIAALGVTQ